ncbi:AAA family ATPase [Bacillus safensis]|uniref:AAA family ATPase n=1 Tax=Bacillus TaxID=1386 RepID=UPI00234B4B29|nr:MULTISPECIES: AAA family ATPase [Bacillus]MEC3814153.1 AAA family ATPase [Bacillus altitudinis]WCL59509.1 AAA family ATPase [Bacillus safensis]
MKTEILKIIEGGLEKNPEKVRSYAKLVSEKLQSQGEDKFAERILNILNNKGAHPVFLDEFMAKPVDTDSRLDMVEITMPDDFSEELILPNTTKIKLESYIQNIKKRDKFIDLGLNLPESLLLYGPPGCGKTSIAHYISKQIGLPLVTAKLDGLVSSLLGSTAKNIRKIFEYAQARPCILFLDEFDAIAKARNDEHEVGELKRVVNSLLQNIDKFNKNSILIAATNHEKLLDPAVWRRFSNTIEVPKPSQTEILELLELFTLNMVNNFTNDTKKVGVLTKLLEGISPSEIKVICINAMRRSVLADENTLSYSNLLYQIHLSRSLPLDQVSLVRFLNENGVSQIDVSKTLGISQRQVRNILNNKGEDDGGKKEKSSDTNI